ncbi:MAG: 2-amino-4-hydroxy-6-hydroxymethyldihydropteridine pyrophosphokinase [Cycloclasticus sp. symbiont of Bathymodiolus heckerae]|nr:MAG: 2-amino-4-hydroxy-6-hydroxymethyldihydropteridine pyrophosphokinase [Cycloclasticus sp. symbiont of Bathymodiolus heckerae]
MSHAVFIGLGSNLSDPIQQVTQSIKELGTLKNCTLIRASSLYETPPMGPQDQPNYVNAVVEIETELSPQALLLTLQTLENQHARTRDTGKWEARTLDLDILHYEGVQSTDATLTLPHSGLHKRNFVLYPLLEISPHLNIPNLGKIAQLIEQLNEPIPTIVQPKSLDK